MATDTIRTPAQVPDRPVSGLPRDGAHHVRGDIEGLRAVAVLLVVADHLFGWPHGGFIGVDVFFVISGFLITGLLLREHQRTGRISFADFYRRRIRRILPASVLVLVVTAVLAQVVFFANRARETVDDALWALLFAGNWHFAIDGTDYQQAGDAVSPLQHYWSLSVEEQFYVVWPVVLLVVLGLAARRGRAGLVAMAVVTVLVVAGGYAWAVHETASAPTWAYFSTFSRSWELGLGALLAVCAPLAVRIPAALRPLLGWAGLVGIAAGAVLIDSSTAFPAPWALVPVLSTVAVIAAGTGGDSRIVLVDNPVGRYIGALSYSLYLWHFPAIVLLAELMPQDGLYYATVGAAALLAATASYHLVEQPIRRSAWLRPGPRPPRRRVAAFGGWAATGLAAALVAVFVVLPASGATWPWPQPASPTAAPPAAPPLVEVDPGAEAAALAAQAQQVLTADIAASLAATEWPELSPGLNSPGEEVYSPEWVVDECLNIADEADMARCSYGDPAAEQTAVLVGDSVAISWMPGIRRALEGSGWRIQVLTLGQCPQVPVEVRAYRGGDNFEEKCPQHQVWALEQVRLIQPDLIIMSSAANSLVRLLSDNSGDAALAEWRTGLTTMLASLEAMPARMVVLGTPPPGENIQECMTRFNGPQDCVSPIGEETNDFIRVEQETVAQFRGTALQASYVDTRSWFCDAAERCPLFVGTVPIYADGTHMVAPYAERLAPLLAPALLG
ncbi:acyltransferase family protein [Blastococcus sp. TF02A-26]|uniref:acyltransferase family protein n=1 Tax=Blastococcus sp. TF02A-26 TaxID=2250577 RepID=UPI000DEA0425|nr:acyltransferase family protein [Blastococcus sp. TF02A-26]RBY87408.1 acyltransferase [Blastococcus sp. TF02A-26]